MDEVTNDWVHVAKTSPGQFVWNGWATVHFSLNFGHGMPHHPFGQSQSNQSLVCEGSISANSAVTIKSQLVKCQFDTVPFLTDGNI